MNALRRGRRDGSGQPPAEAIETACVFVILVAGAALLMLLPYGDIARQLLCFKFYAAAGCAV
jgi:hypothetical protein